MSCSGEKGFSLIELMVVLAIVGSLSILAYPMYASYFVKVKRLEARLALFDLASLMEGYAVETNQGYTGATLSQLGISPLTEKKRYTLAIESANPTQYVISATPTFSDPPCRKLRYNQWGVCSNEGKGSVAECWGG